MAYQEVFRLDTRELVRLWQKGLSQRRIARISGRARDTVQALRQPPPKSWVLEPGGPEPTDEQLAKLAALNLSTPTGAITPAADTLRAPHRADKASGWPDRQTPAHPHS